MSNLAKNEGPNLSPDLIQQVLIYKNTKGLDAGQKLAFLNKLCESLGMNPLTNPFEFLNLNGKEVPYAKKDATDQLRKLYDVSIEIVNRGAYEGVYAVTARAKMPSGRTDEAIGAVIINGLKGDSLANALMKAETKAKRRVTLSICGLGILDETEVETIPGVEIDAKTASEPKQIADGPKASPAEDGIKAEKEDAQAPKGLGGDYVIRGARKTWEGRTIREVTQDGKFWDLFKKDVDWWATKSNVSNTEKIRFLVVNTDRFATELQARAQK